MKKVIRINENDLNIIVSKVLNENTTLQDKILKTIDRIGLIKTLKYVGYKKFNDILPDYFNNRDTKIKLISTITENGLDSYEVFDTDIVYERHDLDYGEYEIDYITYIEGDYVTITTYKYDDDDNQIDEVWDSFTVKIEDLRYEIIDLIFHNMVNKLFK